MHAGARAAAHTREHAEADRPNIPTFVPILTFRQELLLRLLTLAWVLASVWFWLWWTAAERGAWTPGRIVATAGLAWAFALGCYFLFFACRMSRPNPAIPVPELRVALVVTKAPAEAWSLVQETLEAMLAQDFPYAYDVWLADEVPTPESRRWCDEHGVLLSTREGAEDYQRESWPRRRRSKEGNLAYFYDHYGYDRYDVVAQLDADHVPAPTYLAEMVRPFADPAIGYVAAPSVCDRNAHEGWTVRGRVYREATLHGINQAGCNGGWAPVCIGSHYAVRTRALRDVGGIGPELAEDYTTTLWMQAGGWDGAFAIDAEAHGDGPVSLDEMLTQEVQWARSLGTVLLRWAPRRLGKAPRRARLRLGFALAFYPLQALVLITGSLVPAAALLLDQSWVNTSLAGFYVRMWICSVLLLSIVALLRRAGVLRPVDAKLWSVDAVLFQILRWPWASWGCIQGLLDSRRTTPRPFKITPKRDTSIRRLRPALINPMLLLGFLPALAVVLATTTKVAIGFLFIATGQAVLYLGAAAIAVVLHIRGNRRRQLQDAAAKGGGETPPWREILTLETGGAAALNVGVACIAIGGAIAWRFAAYGIG